MMRFFIILFCFLVVSCKPVDLKQQEVVETIPEKSLDTIVFDVIRIRSAPRIETFWPGEMPSFIFCESSGISRSRASQGISYWRRLGYPIDNVRYVDDAPECHGEGPAGTVVIRLVDNTIPIGSNLAVTKVFFYKDTKQIIRADIHLISGYANRARLIEHEIGHALGWKHYNRHLHIMNSEYDNTGHDSTGTGYRRYQDLF